MPFMPLSFFPLRRPLAALVVLLALAACEKPNDELGFDQVIGENIDADSLHIPLTTYTAPIDSVLVAFTRRQQQQIGGYPGTRLLGKETSTYLGETQATLVGQVLPVQLNADFGENPVIDSVNMNLALSQAYGDTTQPINVKVHELSSELHPDSLYYSHYEPQLKRLLGERQNVPVRPESPTTFNGNPAPPVITIPLDTTYFRERFVDEGDGNFAPFADFEAFTEYFKGVKVEVTAGDAILYTDLASVFSALRIHYHNDEDTAFLDLNFRQDKPLLPIHFSTFAQDYRQALVNLDNQDTIKGEARTYVQAMGGVATALKLAPAKMDSLSKEGLVINQARLEIPTAVGTGDPAAPSQRLEMLVLEGRGLGPRAVDFQEDGGDGSLQFGTLRQNRYRFDLTRHLFSALNSGENPTLAVVPRRRTTTANRTILQGGGQAGEPLKLVVYYTQP